MRVAPGASQPRCSENAGRRLAAPDFDQSSVYWLRRVCTGCVECVLAGRFSADPHGEYTLETVSTLDSTGRSSIDNGYGSLDGYLRSRARRSPTSTQPMTDVLRLAGKSYNYLLLFDNAKQCQLYKGRTTRLATPAMDLPSQFGGSGMAGC